MQRIETETAGSDGSSRSSAPHRANLGIVMQNLQGEVTVS
jgi:hypothetical protein